MVILFWILLLPGASHALTLDTVYIEALDTHSVVIRWVTDAPSNGQIKYGLATRESTRVSMAIMNSLSHSSYLSGLLEGENYTYQVSAVGEAGGAARSSWKEFRTQGTPAPKIRGIDIVELTIDGGRIIWKANIPVKGLFECGYDTTYKFKQAEQNFSTAHEVNIKRFGARRQILYRIVAEDARGLKPPVYEGSFTTAENNIALGHSVTGTFTRNPEPGYIKDTPPLISRMTDGRLDFFTGMGASGDPGREEQWAQVDLGKVEIIGKVLTYWWQLAYPQKFVIKASLDGERWDTFGDTNDASTGAMMRSTGGDPIWEHVVDLNGRVYRYIRVEVPAGSPYARRFSKYNYVILFEVKVYPPPLD